MKRITFLDWLTGRPTNPTSPEDDARVAASIQLFQEQSLRLEALEGRVVNLEARLIDLEGSRPHVVH